MKHLITAMWLVLAICGLLPACTPRSLAYRKFYSHLQISPAAWHPMQESENFLILLVEARHLDYSDTRKFFQSVAKHPNDCSKTGDVGHAWIYLQGYYQGKQIVIEGGHSGEVDPQQPRYFDGIMNYNEWGYANPTAEQMRCPRFEPNPAKYLWNVRTDGFFQKGSGHHRPTFAAKVNLSQEQFVHLVNLIQTGHYCLYSLTGAQCSSFVSYIASQVGLELPCQVTMTLAPSVYFRRYRVRMWHDPCYASITFATPDMLEKSLIEAVKEGKAEYALDWYLQT